MFSTTCFYILFQYSELHPIFYGCFDWHSSVHGHWLLAKVKVNQWHAQRFTKAFLPNLDFKLDVDIQLPHAIEKIIIK